MGGRRAKTLVSLLKTEGEGKGEGGEVIKFPSDSLIHFAESQGRLSAQEELGNGWRACVLFLPSPFFFSPWPKVK